MDKVLPSEGDVALTKTFHLLRGVNMRLGRELEDAYVPVAGSVCVLVKQGLFSGEDVVELTRCAEEFLKVRRVLLVPENGGNSAAAAFLNEIVKGLLRASGARDLVQPGASVTVPRRFNENVLGL